MENNARVCKWFDDSDQSLFGRTEIYDESRSSRPRTSTNTDIIAAIHAIVQNNRRVTIDDIQHYNI